MAEGLCVAGAGACMAVEMATGVDSMHPTGMNFCHRVNSKEITDHCLLNFFEK